LNTIINQGEAQAIRRKIHEINAGLNFVLRKVEMPEQKMQVTHMMTSISAAINEIKAKHDDHNLQHAYQELELFLGVLNHEKKEKMHELRHHAAGVFKYLRKFESSLPNPGFFSKLLKNMGFGR
jgi:hypothetical protein